MNEQIYICSVSSILYSLYYCMLFTLTISVISDLLFWVRSLHVIHATHMSCDGKKKYPGQRDEHLLSFIFELKHANSRHIYAEVGRTQHECLDFRYRYLYFTVAFLSLNTAESYFLHFEIKSLLSTHNITPFLYNDVWKGVR